MYVTLEKLQSEGREFYIVVPVTGGHLYERSGQCARHHQHGTVLKLRNYLSVCVPIEPVEPRIAIFFMISHLPSLPPRANILPDSKSQVP